MIDRVRAITNIFTGRTGAQIALTAWQHGHRVSLLTSHPEVIADLRGPAASGPDLQVDRYRTFEQLEALMASAIQAPSLDAVVHCAAVSDYLPAGVYAPASNTHFDPSTKQWHAPAGESPRLLDRAAGKVKSEEPELWLRLKRAPKLVDRIRIDWRFRGLLVKFKLEVGVSEEKLREIAERSRQQSGADLMVANTLEGAADWALLGPVADAYERVPRAALGKRLLESLEQLHQERGHG